MKTEVITPRELFKQPQQLAVPLFQRSFAWKEVEQWAPLWRDVTRVADRALTDRLSVRPHFLGALVHQQVGFPAGHIQEWTVIDGQQRLTTLQLMMSAIHGQLVTAGVHDAAKRIQNLIENEAEYRQREHDRFKVWPTNRDRAAFRSVMEAPPPVHHKGLEFWASRIVQAHRFFSERAEEWLQADGPSALVEKANALERTVSELIEMVVIRLAPDENAQEIFETLNARGAQLTSADLIKNFVFQELIEARDDVESVYDEYWKEFETPFWESEISLGRYRQVRSSAFLYHWLVAHTATKDPIPVGQVFERFKEHALESSGEKMSELVTQIHRASKVYATVTWIPPGKADPLGTVDIFAYRASVLQSELVKAALLLLLDPEREQLPPDQLQKALRSLESWLVRRTLVRAGTKAYNKVFVDLMNVVRQAERSRVGDVLEGWLEKQTSQDARWPDNKEVRESLQELPVYRLLSRGRLRMILEAVEDHLRGFDQKKHALAEGRCSRSTLSIEHVMPQRWQARYWPLPREVSEDDRRAVIQTIGNLTLVTSPLNATMKRAQWSGPTGKRQALKAHSVLRLNKELIDEFPHSWNEENIEERGEWLIKAILQVWPVPPGHKVQVEHKKAATMHDVTFTDFLEAGIVADGDVLYPIPKKWLGHYATVLADGRISVNGIAFDAPREAEKAITHRTRASGWRFFALDPEGTKSLRNAWLDAQDEEAEESGVAEEEGDLEDAALDL